MTNPDQTHAATEDPRPPIDTEWLTRMQTTKPDFLRRLFEVFLTEEPQRVASLAAAINKHDMEMVRYLAHSLKGAAATLGMERVRDACRELEFAAKDGDSGQFALCHQHISSEMDAVYAVIRATMPPKA
jgi:FOG: HPt domain